MQMTPHEETPIRKSIVAEEIKLAPFPQSDQEEQQQKQQILMPIAEPQMIAQIEIDQREKNLYQPKTYVDLIGKGQFFAFIFMVLLVAISLIIVESFLPSSLETPDYLDICSQNFTTENAFVDKYCLSGQQSVRATVIKGLQEKNQLLTIYGQFSFNIIPNIDLSYINYTASIFSVKQGSYDEKELYEQLIVGHDHSLSASCDIDQEYLIYHANQSNNNDFKMRKKCSEILLIYMPQLKKSTFLFIVNFTDIAFPSDNYLGYFPLSDVNMDLSLYTINSEYTENLIIIRYTLLGLSIISLIYYWQKLKFLKISELLLEQKFILVLSILQCFFNDPFYAILVQKPNFASSVVDIIFICNFLCGLLLYWMVQFEIIIDSNNNSFQTKYFYYTGALTALFWIFLVGSYIILTNDFLNDPSSSFYNNNTDLFFAFRLIALFFLGLITIYFLKSFFTFYKIYNSRIRRYQFMGIFNFYFIFILIIIIFFGNLDGIYNGSSLFIIITLFNLYIYFQQLMWSPLKKKAIEQNVLQKAYEIACELSLNSEIDCEGDGIDNQQLQEKQELN